MIAVVTVLGIALAAVPIVEVMYWPKIPAAWFAVKRGMSSVDAQAALSSARPLLPRPHEEVERLQAEDGAWRLTVELDDLGRVRAAIATYTGRRFLASADTVLFH